MHIYIYIYIYFEEFSYLNNMYRLLYSWLYNTEIYLDKCSSMVVIWVQIYFGIVQLTVYLPFYYISNCYKKMPLLNYILF